VTRSIQQGYNNTRRQACKKTTKVHPFVQLVSYSCRGIHSTTVSVTVCVTVPLTQ